MRYIELNPVRAGLAENPGQYRWSSHGTNAPGQRDPLLSLHPRYAALGPSAPEGRHAYRELFRHHLDNTLPHEIREALNHILVPGCICHFVSRS